MVTLNGIYMMKTRILTIVIASLPWPAMAQPAGNAIPAIAMAAAAPGSVWSINVVGLKGEPLGTITLELLDEGADTCMSGEWKKARLMQSSFHSPAQQFETGDYFPTYETHGPSVTIQLNPPGLCDAYLFLEGKFTEHDGKGDYVGLSLGGTKPLGTFTARRQKP
ncbi:MAG TPA: hypothetical protein VLC74_02020 [Rhizomicrobium sp.]|nr:hypothetical protein [Rhizomicrobium sp.]